MLEEGLLAIFPLSNVALFPDLEIPLHIFEPRYRQMIADSLAGARRIGMVTVRPEAAGDMAGDPVIFPIGCAGIITRAQQLPDGRFHLLLRGTERFRVEEEPPRPDERLYRAARVETIVDACDATDAARIEASRERVMALLDALAAAEGADAPDAGALGTVDDVRLVNGLSNGLAFSPAEKQRLLEADSIAERFERLGELMSFRIAEREAVGSPNSGAFH
jgi:Lon protease-like protein